jgi:hypothetical protein
VTGGGTNSYQWQRNEVNIPGANSATYLLTDADASMAIRCVQTATNGPASDVEFSAETGPILFGFTLLTEAGSSTITAFPTIAPQWQQIVVFVSIASMVLGGGRAKASDKVDPRVGLELHVRLGDKVVAGQPLATLHHADTGKDDAVARVSRAYVIDDEGAAFVAPSLFGARIAS